MKRYLAIGLFLLLYLLYSILPLQGNTSTIVTLPDGSSYDITCTLSGITLVCDIAKVSGKYLSHWVLDLGVCNDAVLSTDPSATFTQNDPTTGATGWKFEPIVDQTATYTLTLNSLYGTGTVTATMKAGAIGNYASVLVEGPNCQVVDPTTTPTSTPEPTQTPTSTPSPTVTLTGPFVSTSTPTPTQTTTGEATATPTVTIQPLDPTVTPTATGTVVVEGPTGEGEVAEPLKIRVYVPDVRVGGDE